jgi:hypothetical protein
MAQTEQGSIMIGGTAGFMSSKVGDADAIIAVDVAPMIGFFVIDKLAVGGNLEFAYLKDGFTSFGIQPMVRYYFIGTGNVRPFGQGQFEWSTFKLEGLDQSQNGLGFGAGIGADFFLNSNVAIEALFGYDSFKFKDAEDPTGTFGIQIGIAAFLSGGGK